MTTRQAHESDRDHTDATRPRAGRDRIMVTAPTKHPGGGTYLHGALRRRVAVKTGRGVRHRAAWLLTLSLTVLLGGALAAAAWAAPVPRQPMPNTPVPIPTVSTCTPGSVEPICHLPAPTTTTPSAPMVPPPITSAPPTNCDPVLPLGCEAPVPTTTPCVGEGCIPQPTATAPGSGRPSDGSNSDSGQEDCSIWHPSDCIVAGLNYAFKNVVTSALSPILDALGHVALNTPTLDQLPGIGELWNANWQIVLAGYGMLIMVGGIVVMAHESVQTRYSIKEIGPRVVLGFLASALSLFFADKFIRIANALALAVVGDVDPPSLGSTMKDVVQGLATSSLFVTLLALVLVVLGLGLLIVYVIRVVITLILIVAGPLLLMCHCLPHTDPLARWWWKAMAAALAIQIAQAVALMTAVRMFLSGGIHLFGSGLSALASMVTAIALFFIVFKIPFWILSTIKVGRGRSFLGGLARAYVAAKTFGLIAGKAGAFGRSGATAGAGTSRGPRGGGTTVADPPWPPQPRITPTAGAVNTRMRQAYDAERARTLRQPRLPSQTPRFLQPTPQTPTHDPAVDTATPGNAVPEFSSASPPQASPPPPGVRRRRAATTQRFQTPGGPRRYAADQPPVRPVRVAAVPQHLQFRPPTADSPHLSRPVPASGKPATPMFRPAQPEPRLGDAYRRTQSAPPVAFRAPKPGGAS